MRLFVGTKFKVILEGQGRISRSQFSKKNGRGGVGHWCFTDTSCSEEFLLLAVAHLLFLKQSSAVKRGINPVIIINDSHRFLLKVLSCYWGQFLQAWLLPDLNMILNSCVRENSL